jgi:uncharacterized repeat protein (TIGR03843 family)
MISEQVGKLLQTLAHGEIEVVGQFRWSSNFTFLVEVCEEGQRLPAVYKPTQGERPLWDFPRETLATREVAAYLTSESLGWDLVPPTTLREGGPAGPGSIQLFIHADPERHYFTFTEEEKQRLRPVVLFDLLVNNADRKGGHILLDANERVVLIDHGLCFHEEDKLRTVLWDFIGEPIPDPLLQDVQMLLQRLEREDELADAYSALISPAELEALLQRARDLLVGRLFPEPQSGRPYPYPLV